MPSHKVALDQAQVNSLMEPYGLRATNFHPLTGGMINTSLCIETDRGQFVLRIYPRERRREEVLFELSVLKHTAAANLPTPRVIVDLYGQTLHTTPTGNLYAVFTFITAKQGNETTLTRNLAGAVGKFIGQMQNALAGKSLDGEKLVAEAPFIKTLLMFDGAAATEARTYWTMCRDYFEKRNLPQGVVHADLYPGNVLVDEAGDLAAVIDFDDCYWGTQIFDVAIAAMEFSCSGECDFAWELAIELVAEYAKWQPVDPEDVYVGMLLNCLRFFGYTVQIEQSYGESAAQNAYFKRAQHLSNPRTKAEFMDEWNTRFTG